MYRRGALVFLAIWLISWGTLALSAPPSEFFVSPIAWPTPWELTPPYRPTPASPLPTPVSPRVRPVLHGFFYREGRH